VATRDDELLFVASASGEHAAEWIADEATTPELQAAIGRACVTGAVDCRDAHPTSDRVRPLHRLPGVCLGRAVLGLFARVATDGRRVDENLSAGEGGKASGFGIPLVPAD